MDALIVTQRIAERHQRDLRAAAAHTRLASVVLGADVQILHPSLVNLYGCTIGDATRIGPFVEIQQGAVIGSRCKVSSHTFICKGVALEDEVFVGHGVMFTNDRYPRATNPDGSVQVDRDWPIQRTLVKRRAAIGSGATILCGVTIGEGALVGAGATVLPGIEIGWGAVVGAGAVVTRDVEPGAVVAGNPARVLRNEPADGEEPVCPHDPAP